MATITLTPDPTTASVDVLVQGLPNSGPWQITRTDGQGTPRPLRGSPFTAVGGTIAVVDSEALFGTPLTYEVASGDTAMTTLDVDVPWLTHPLSPFYSTPCVIDDDTDWIYPGRTYTFDIINRTTPVYTWYRRASRTGRLVVEYRSVQERYAIRTALETGAPMLVRYPADYPQFPSTYIGISEVRIVPRGVGSQQGVIEMDYTEVSAPGSEAFVSPPGDWLWDDVVAGYPTWNDVVAAETSWATLLFNEAGA